MTKMTRTNQDNACAQQWVNLAIKTTVRDALFLVYKKKFPAAHPGKTPNDIVSKDEDAKKKLSQNATLREIIEKNEEDKFDMTALYLILRSACGLSTKKNDWRNPKKLEGNIEILRQLRNSDGHWTRAFESQGQRSWGELEKALEKILILSGLSSVKEKFKEELANICSKKQNSLSLPKQVQKSIRCELEEHYKSGRKTTLLPIVWGGRNFSFNHHVEKTFTNTRLTVLCDGVIKNLDYEGLQDHLLTSRIIIVQGESGTGKTSLLRHFAATWAGNANFLEHIDYLVFLDCTAISRKTFTLSDTIQELFPETYAKWKPKTILKELINAGNSVMFMIDAFDERLEAFQRAFGDLQRKCSKAYFVISTRPHCTPAITRLCTEKSLILTMRGFNWSCAEEYVRRLFKAQASSEDPKVFLELLSKFEEIYTIPQLLCWTSWFWLEKGRKTLSTRGKLFSNITDFMLRKMCHIHGKRVLSEEVPKDGQSWLNAVSQLAFTQVKEGQMALSESSRQIKKLYNVAKKLYLRPQVAVSSLMQCDSQITATGEHIIYQFLHDAHVNFLGAYHIHKVIQSNRKLQLKTLLEGIDDERRKSLLLFLVSLMFKDGTADVDMQRILEVVHLSKDFVKFYDISFYLDLIDESSISISLSKELAKFFPTGPQSSEELSSSNTAGFEKQLGDHVWLHTRDLEHDQALQSLLSEAKPARIWLRMCDGTRKNKENNVSDQKTAGKNVASAITLLSEAYGVANLPELRLSDCKVDRCLQWPKNLWWLVLERCELKSNIGLRRGLLKLTFNECCGLNKIKTIPSSIRTLKLQRMKVEEPLPSAKLQHLALEHCTIKDLSYLPKAYKRLRLLDCKIQGTINDFPGTMECLYISLPKLMDDIMENLCKPHSMSEIIHMFQCVSEEFIKDLNKALHSNQSLNSLSVKDIALTPESFSEFFLNFQENHKDCKLVLSSLCNIREGDSEIRHTIRKCIMSSQSPVTVSFGDEVFQKD